MEPNVQFVFVGIKMHSTLKQKILKTRFNRRIVMERHLFVCCKLSFNLTTFRFRGGWDVPLYYFSQSLRRKKAITLSSYVKKISYYIYS